MDILEEYTVDSVTFDFRMTFHRQKQVMENTTYLFIFLKPHLLIDWRIFFLILSVEEILNKTGMLFVHIDAQCWPCSTSLEYSAPHR